LRIDNRRLEGHEIYPCMGSTLAEETDTDRQRERQTRREEEITKSKAFSLNHKYALPNSYSSNQLLLNLTIHV
jgi:hypothetical protein